MKEPSSFAMVVIVLVSVLAVLAFMNAPGTKGNFSSEQQGSNLVGQAAAPAPSYCANGVRVGACYSSKPKFCATGAKVVNNCGYCGCPSGQICGDSGACFTPTAFKMKSYIEDNLDNLADSERDISTYFGPGASTFGWSKGPKQVDVYDSDALFLPNGGAISNPAGLPISEYQNVYVFANTAYDYSLKAVQAKSAKTGYEAVFKNPLPACLDVTKPYSACPDDKKLGKSGVRIWLLGSSWLVTNYVPGSYGEVSIPPYIGLKRSDGKVMGLRGDREIEYEGSKFWKAGIWERDYPTYALTQDELVLEMANNLIVSMADGSMLTGDFVSVASKREEAFAIGTYAVVSTFLVRTDVFPTEIYYLDSNGLYVRAPVGIDMLYLRPTGVDHISFNLYKELTLDLDGGATVTADMVRFTSSNPEAFQFGAAMPIESDSIFYVVGPTSGNASNLTMPAPGTIYVLNSNTGLYAHAGVNVLPYYFPTQPASEAIYKIQIYNDIDQLYKTPITSSMNPGDKINVIQYPAGFSFWYKGLDAAYVAKYRQLQFSVQKSQTLTTGAGSWLTGDFIFLSTENPNAFQYGGKTYESVYILVQESNFTNITAGSIVILGFDPTLGYFVKLPVPAYVACDRYGCFYDAALDFHVSASETSQIRMSKNSYPYQRFRLYLPENTETALGVSSYTEDYHFDLLYDLNLRQFVNTLGNPAVDKVAYSYGYDIAEAAKEAGFVSPRGTVFLGISPTSAAFNYPASVVKANFELVANGDDIVWTSGSGTPIDAK